MTGLSEFVRRCDGCGQPTGYQDPLGFSCQCPAPPSVVEAVVLNVADEEQLVPPPNQPMLVAEEVVDRRHRDDRGVLTLRWWRGSFYRWTAGHWVEIEDRTVRSELYQMLKRATWWDATKQETKPWSPNRYRVGDVLDALVAVGHTDQHTKTPSWLQSRAGDHPASELVAVGNGLLHVPTRQLVEHTPRLFNTVAVPFPYQPHAQQPLRWLAFLEELWPDDPDAVSALQEWFGYVVSGDTRMHKILFVLGPMRSGKGTIGRVLKALIGESNTCGPTLASLGTNFGLQDLVGKSLAIVADARLNTANANVVVERLLSISGEDSLTIDRKYRDHWFGKLDTRFVIFSNELPGFGDASGAIATRFLVLTLGRSWLGQENHDLTSQLLTELPGILNWALDGLARLRSQDRFTEPVSSRDAIVALADTVSPISAFVRDRCLVGPAHQVAVNELYQAWRDWCEEQGRDRPGSAAVFGKNLRATQPGVRKVRPREGDQRPQVYNGVTLRKQWPVTVTSYDHPSEEADAVTAAGEQKSRSAGVVTAGHGTFPLFSAQSEDGPPGDGDRALARVLSVFPGSQVISSPSELSDLPLGEVGTCRICQVTTVRTDAEGAICATCHDQRWAS